VCVYRSAEEQDVLEQEERSKGLEQSQNGPRKYFCAQERLLDREGDLAAEEVLLAQGHQKLALVPLMIYLLLHCDALRRSPAPLDLRVSALMQMASMLPTTLARAIAPRMQLWESMSTTNGKDDSKEEDDCPILDIMDLSSTAVQEAIMEYSQTAPHPLLLFLDAPDQILLLNARHVVPNSTTPVVKSKTTKSAPPVLASPALRRAVQEAADSYRICPPILEQLEDPSANNSSSSEEEALLRLIDCFIEDAPNVGTPARDANFAAWRTRMAHAVHAYVFVCVVLIELLAWFCFKYLTPCLLFYFHRELLE